MPFPLYGGEGHIRAVAWRSLSGLQYDVAKWVHACGLGRARAGSCGLGRARVCMCGRTFSLVLLVLLLF